MAIPDSFGLEVRQLIHCTPILGGCDIGNQDVRTEVFDGLHETAEDDWLLPVVKDLARQPARYLVELDVVITTQECWVLSQADHRNVVAPSAQPRGQLEDDMATASPNCEMRMKESYSQIGTSLSLGESESSPTFGVVRLQCDREILRIVRDTGSVSNFWSPSKERTRPAFRAPCSPESSLTTDMS